MIPGISKGKVLKPANIILYGPDGVGKSTFIAEAPRPVFLGPEDGSSELDVHRFEGVRTMNDVRKNLHRLINEDLPFDTVGLDSIDWIETLLHQEICETQGKETIEDCFGSFGKWVYGVNSEWMKFFDLLKTVREKKKMNIISVAHAKIKTFNDPTTALAYDRYMLKFHNDAAAGLWREFVDCVLFANFEVVVKASGNNKKATKGKAYGDDARAMYSQRRPSFDAKNRYGLPFELPLGWDHFHSARVAGNPDSLQVVKSDLVELVALVPQEKREAMQTAITKAGDDVAALIKIRNYARTMAGES